MARHSWGKGWEGRERSGGEAREKEGSRIKGGEEKEGRRGEGFHAGTYFFLL